MFYAATNMGGFWLRFAARRVCLILRLGLAASSGAKPAPARRMKMNAMKLAVPLFVALAYGPSPALATPILDGDLATFAILGGGGVTIGGTGSVINGSVGAYPTTSITGVIPTHFNISGGTVQSGGGTAMSAQGELTIAINALTARV